jgi:hypothetical protein
MLSQSLRDPDFIVKEPNQKRPPRARASFAVAAIR